MNIALAKTREKQLLWVLGSLLVVTVTYLAWPRPFQPPLQGLGKPIHQNQAGVKERYLYSFPGDHWSYAPTAASILAQQGFKPINKDLNWYHDRDGRTVIIYPGKWKPWRTSEGMVDTFVKGWVTVACDAPPNRLRQLWLEYKLGSRKPAKVAATSPRP